MQSQSRNLATGILGKTHDSLHVWIKEFRFSSQKGLKVGGRFSKNHDAMCVIKAYHPKDSWHYQRSTCQMKYGHQNHGELNHQNKEISRYAEYAYFEN
jgi:hypothetical protein